jgi:glutamate formiminotransferase/glutamate formiminotransferase/formiminotetrahydrofolate cyclodeaminase
VDSAYRQGVPAALPLVAVPNVSEGRDPATLDAITTAFAADARVVDRHRDPDHHRAVFTIAGEPGRLARALLAGAGAAVARIDLAQPRGVHPHVGAIDVVPVVYWRESLRGAACVEALLAADLIAGELGVPVFLYGALGGGRTRAELRRGGREGLAAAIAAGELSPDFGPRALHPSAGATLIAARAPLVAFNLELAPPADLAVAKRIAALIREPGMVAAIGVSLASRGGAAQVSMNIENPFVTPLASVIERVATHAEVAAAEIVGLVPRSALAGFPAEIEIRGFDPSRQIAENALTF